MDSDQIKQLSELIDKVLNEIRMVFGEIQNTEVSREIQDEFRKIEQKFWQVRDELEKVQKEFGRIEQESSSIKHSFRDIQSLSEGITQRSDKIKYLSDSDQIKKRFAKIKRLSQTIIHLLEKDPSQIELYKIYRDYIKHEDSLINNRLTWLLLAEGFIFTAYSRIVTASNGSSILKDCLPSILKTLSWTGFLVAAFGAFGIAASIFSIKSINDLGKEKLPNPNNLGLLELTGGNSDCARKIGLIPQVTIPPLIICIWVYLLSEKLCVALLLSAIFIVLILGLYWYLFID